METAKANCPTSGHLSFMSEADAAKRKPARTHTAGRSTRSYSAMDRSFGGDMRRRALLIGSQSGHLTGVHADIDLMNDVLTSFGFETTTLIEGRATRSGIIDAYRGLITDTRSGDGAVVYFSGHGGRIRNPMTEDDPSVPGWLPYLCPTDFDSPGPAAFPGLLAAELSRLQWELTLRTANVTTILDCCHAGRMARDPRFTPKAVPRPMDAYWAMARAAWESVRAGGGYHLAADANPSAVRLVACAPNESAYEAPVPGFSTRQGVLTAALADLLQKPGSQRLTWRRVVEQLRLTVSSLMPGQRPDVEGPADRVLFDVREAENNGALPVQVTAEGMFLDGAEIFGVGPGDTYALVAPGADPGAPVLTAVVDRLAGGRAWLRALHSPTAPGPALSPALPVRAEAHPLRVALGRRPVAVTPLDHPGRGRLTAALAGSAHVRVVDEEQPVMTTLALSDDGVQLLDELGEPLLDRPRPCTDEMIGLLGSDLQQLARASHLRALTSGVGAAELDSLVEITHALVADGTERPLDRSGEHLFTGDQVLLRIRNHGSERRFVSVFDIGLRGTVSLLTTSERSGVGLDPGEQYELYRHPTTHELAGITLFWPEGLPKGTSRLGTFLTIVTDQPQDLSRLTQQGLKRSDRAHDASSLQQLLDNLLDGVRDGAAPAWATHPLPVIRYRVSRLDTYLHPESRADISSGGLQ
ncbi:caspase family protein [Streptomyces sp. NPDC026206]|uniref:caspase family protein n=1 Tax=Streptomyces sp. NPDC026206 TaxID=3157089 RepID=UPI0033F813A5